MRCVSVVPSYLLVLVAMTIVGAVLAAVIADVFLPLSRQRGFYGMSIVYRYEINGSFVYITLANRENYDAKVDVLLIGTDNSVVTACLGGFIRSSLGDAVARRVNGSFSLLGIDVAGNEVLDILCYAGKAVRDVRVNEYGVAVFRQAQAYVGGLPGYYSAEVGFGLGQTWSISQLYFRIPITVISAGTYTPAYVEVSIDALPSDLRQFFLSHTQPSLIDVLVADDSGHKYPTKAVRDPSGSVKIYFKVDRLDAGVHYFYLYFGNPYISSPLYPLNETVQTSGNPRLVPGPTSLPTKIDSSMAFPGYIIPEANFLQQITLAYGLFVTSDKNTFSSLYNSVKNGNGQYVLQLINSVQNNQKPFPVGTKTSSYQPKTDLGNAPWGVFTAVRLPTIYMLGSGTAVTSTVWVSSDDGAAAYLYMYSSNTYKGMKVYFDGVYDAHGASYWNYQSTTSVRPDSGTTPYLIVLQQNGICGCSWWSCPCGNGPGWLDFRFAMWYVEQLSANAPSAQEFASLATGKYIKVTIYGVGVNLDKYAFPLDITGSPLIDWKIFSPSTVYVVDESGNPVYYWVQTDGGRTIIWIGVRNLPASGSRTYTIYYGGYNRYSSYSNPNNVFDFFDDFNTNPLTNDKWKITTNRITMPPWDSTNKILYLINNTYETGVAMFMNIDWRKNFHVHFKVYMDGNADGLAFGFFKQDFTPYVPESGSTLALTPLSLIIGGEEAYKGYAVEFDLYQNEECTADPKAPHIALVETFSGPDVACNQHYAAVSYDPRGSWHTVDIYYVNGNLTVYVDGMRVLNYVGGIFLTYGIQYGGMAITAATGGKTGVFAVAGPVYLRYYFGYEPRATIST